VPASSRPLQQGASSAPQTTALPSDVPFAFARRLLVRAASTKTGGGLRGDVKVSLSFIQSEHTHLLLLFIHH
jgi:hypothetical protein